MESLHFQYPGWYLLLCVILGVGFALALYMRDKSFQDQKPWVRMAMTILRGLTVSLLAALLLAPFLKLFQNTTKNPIIVVAQDNSQSVGNQLTGDDSIAFVQSMNDLNEAVGARFDLVNLQFGEAVQEGSDPDYADALTDISDPLVYISEQYDSELLGAVVLASDGLYNRGSNPLYLSSAINAPVHVIALGDTSVKTDLRIAKVLHNDIAFLGSKFPVQIDIAATNLDARQATLTVSKVGGGNIYQETFQIESDDFFKTTEVLLEAESPGVERYRFRVSGVAGEENYANNSRDVYIEIIDGRLNVLLLGDVPHPDLSGLKEAISTNENYSVDIFLFEDFQGNPEDYDLVLLHGLPSIRRDITALHSLLVSREIPRIYIASESTSLSRFNAIQDLVRIDGTQQSANEVTAIIDPDFQLFTVPEELTNQIGNFAPLYAPYGEYTINPAASVLMYQKIGSVDTQFPLALFGQADNVKIGVIAAEGLWKWRLYDFLQNESHDLTNTLINKSIQYVTVKDDKRKFRVSPVKNLFTDIETITFTAELYNLSYELINDPDAFLVVTDSAGNAYDYTFNKASNSYSIDIGKFPVGEYTYRGFTDYGGQRLQASGRFSVKAIQLELFDNTADHAMLYQLADKHGGTVYYPDQIAALTDNLVDNEELKPVIYSSAKNTPVLNLRWLFALFLLLLGAEWFFRRYFGGY